MSRHSRSVRIERKPTNYSVHACSPSRRNSFLGNRPSVVGVDRPITTAADGGFRIARFAPETRQSLAFGFLGQHNNSVLVFYGRIVCGLTTSRPAFHSDGGQQCLRFNVATSKDGPVDAHAMPPMSIVFLATLYERTSNEGLILVASVLRHLTPLRLLTSNCHALCREHN
jgi:hypothetical protein